MCWKHYKIVFSATDSNICMVTNKYHFPKTDSFSENARFFPSEHNSVCLVFPKKRFLQKTSFLFTTTQKTIFLKKSMFEFVHLFSFSFSNIKKAEQMHSFFRKPFCWHPDNQQKKRAPTHYSCFLNAPNTTKFGGKQANKSWPIFDATYICCRVKTWSKIWPFLSQNLVQGCVKTWSKIFCLFSQCYSFGGDFQKSPIACRGVIVFCLRVVRVSAKGFSKERVHFSAFFMLEKRREKMNKSKNKS